MMNKVTDSSSQTWNDVEALRAIEAGIGRPPRRLSWLRLRSARSKPASWVGNEPLSKTFAKQGRIIRHGEVRWAHVVQANNSIFSPGPIDLPGQVIYSQMLDVTVEQLSEIARRIFELKHAATNDSEQGKVGQMLASEMSVGLGRQVPTSLTGGRDVFLTDFSFPRQHMPGGLLALNYFPVFADPGTRMAIMISGRYWPDVFRNAWQSEADLAKRNWDVRAMEVLKQNQTSEANIASPSEIVKLSAGAAEMIRKIIAQQKLGTARLHVELNRGREGGFAHELKFITTNPDPVQQLTYDCLGVAIVIDRDDAAFLTGTTIDFRNDKSGHGFVFKNPNL